MDDSRTPRIPRTPRNPPEPRKSRRYGLRRYQRLRDKRAFSRVFEQGIRKSRGPIVVIGAPNSCGYVRLGLAVGRRVGSAPVRNRIKRLIREAFRLQQHDWPVGYDLVVIARPHKPARLADYQRMLFAAVRAVHLGWQRRQRQQQKKEANGEPDA